MCKVLMLTNGQKVTDLKKLVNVVKGHITQTDRHGFGWCGQGVNGVFGERMTEMHHGYRLDRNNLACNVKMLKPTYNSYGTKSDLIGPMLFHGRTSTNDKTLKNTHPIVKNNWHLIHNGVVDNKGPSYEMETTNDTEHLVHYMSNGGITEIEKHVTGYFAFGAIDPAGLLHVSRDSMATLYISWSRTIESFIIATTMDLLSSVAKEMKYKLGPIELIEDNVYSVFDLNSEVSCIRIEPRGYEYNQYKYARQSMSYLGDDEYWESKYNHKKTVADTIDEAEARETSQISIIDATVMDTAKRSELQTVEDLLESDEASVFFDEAYLLGNDAVITNATGDLISVTQFDTLSQMEQLACEILRPDGTVLSFDAICREVESNTQSIRSGGV